MELNRRKSDILAAIVEAYIRTGEPVGSKSVAAMLGDTVSPATVRNDMAVLAERGLLEQPYTSAGRIPSYLGIRHYVDHLMRKEPLGETQRSEIDALFNYRDPDPDRVLEGVAKKLARDTSCFVISTTLSRESLFVRKIEIIPATAHTVVILLLASNGMVKNKVYRVNFELTPKVVEFFQNFANGRLAGRSLNEISHRYINAMALSLGEHADVFSPLLASIYELCREAADGQMYHSGTGSLLEHAELRSIADQLFRLLNSREKMGKLFGDSTQGLFCSIGRENPHIEMQNSSLIVSKYRIGEDSVGALGLFGPLRMNYARLIPQLEYFSGVLSKMLSDTLARGL